MRRSQFWSGGGCASPLEGPSGAVENLQVHSDRKEECRVLKRTGQSAYSSVQRFSKTPMLVIFNLALNVCLSTSL